MSIHLKSIIRVSVCAGLLFIAPYAKADWCIFRLNPTTKLVEKICQNMVASPTKEEVEVLRKGLAKECVVESIFTPGLGTTTRRLCR